ncbi:hypothetical protein Spb1_03620 [Planctopirus ephydatiae]|uniref:Uncharacterized protein n=1 Tax=Planctopirus ephydatiae TaxID=2528019 RepID=A0A518GIT6_9PLAN|nr:hypothetical protein Spb1_03620 [Planctopirus ephydatiae]
MSKPLISGLIPCVVQIPATTNLAQQISQIHPEDFSHPILEVRPQMGHSETLP